MEFVITGFCNRSTRDEAKIAAWESTQKQKAEVKLRKAEVCLNFFAWCCTIGLFLGEALHIIAELLWVSV
jgi:hypothetical protein